MKNILIIGAAGDVGQGMVAQFLGAGHRVLAVGRNAQRLEALRDRFASDALLEILPGDISNETAAAALRDAAIERLGRLDAVIATMTAPHRQRSLETITADEFAELFRDNVLTHFVAAKTFVPVVEPAGLYLAIGGGLADLLVPRAGHVGVCQAAQRRLFLALAAELGDRVRIHELMIYSMVAGASNRAKARPEWLTDDEVGRYAVTMLEQPERFTDPIVKLQSREQLQFASSGVR
jgi:NAD(P)-dependent dehydrogenase (short-subunit alcohol dehydrogenase family)